MMNLLMVIAVNGAEGATGAFLKAHHPRQLRDGVWILKMNADVGELLTMLIGFKGEQGDIAVFEIKKGEGTAGFPMSSFHK